MRLKPARIGSLAELIVTILEKEKFIETVDKSEIINGIASILTGNMQKEEDLDEDVRKILDQYADKMDQDRIQYHEMFKMVKEKLAKERNFIL